MEVQIAVAKVGKWASRESGDTLEMVERPGGGLSLVLVDGQDSGQGAKAISNVVARKAISLLAEGVRDGAVARAAHDTLFALHNGRVQATLNIVSLDLVSGTLVVSRNNPCPAHIVSPDGVRDLSERSQPLGLLRHNRPSITELPLAAGTVAVVYTDGLAQAGARRGQTLDVRAAVEGLVSEGLADGQHWADRLLARALDRDEGHANDDISVVVVAVLERSSGDNARRLLVRMPL